MACGKPNLVLIRMGNPAAKNRKTIAQASQAAEKLKNIVILSLRIFAFESPDPHCVNLTP